MSITHVIKCPCFLLKFVFFWILKCSEYYDILNPLREFDSLFFIANNDERVLLLFLLPIYRVIKKFSLNIWKLEIEFGDKFLNQLKAKLGIIWRRQHFPWTFFEHTNKHVLLEPLEPNYSLQPAPRKASSSTPSPSMIPTVAPHDQQTPSNWVWDMKDRVYKQNSFYCFRKL